MFKYVKAVKFYNFFKVYSDRDFKFKVTLELSDFFASNLNIFLPAKFISFLFISEGVKNRFFMADCRAYFLKMPQICRKEY
jgi:hypothetical protein